MRWDPPELVGVEAVSPTQQPSNRFLQWRVLHLSRCEQLLEISKLPPSITQVRLSECTSLERLPFNNIWSDSPELKWINFSDCSEHIGNDLQILLSSEGHPNKYRGFEFGCIYSGNMIPDYFSYRKECLHTNSCEMDFNGPQPFDFKNTIFAFSAVIGFRTEKYDDGYMFAIHVDIINDGQNISFTRAPANSETDVFISTRADHVWLGYTVPYHSQLKTNNFQVEFTLLEGDFDPSTSVFFQSCGFHLEHRYEEKAVDSMDGIQHSKRCHDDDDDGNLESQLGISDVDEMMMMMMATWNPKSGNLEF